MHLACIRACVNNNNVDLWRTTLITMPMIMVIRVCIGDKNRMLHPRVSGSNAKTMPSIIGIFAEFLLLCVLSLPFYCRCLFLFQIVHVNRSMLIACVTAVSNLKISVYERNFRPRWRRVSITGFIRFYQYACHLQCIVLRRWKQKNKENTLSVLLSAKYSEMRRFLFFTVSNYLSSYVILNTIPSSHYSRFTFTLLEIV